MESFEQSGMRMDFGLTPHRLHVPIRLNHLLVDDHYPFCAFCCVSDSPLRVHVGQSCGWEARSSAPVTQRPVSSQSPSLHGFQLRVLPKVSPESNVVYHCMG